MMLHENRDEITFESLKHFLLRIGFGQPTTISNSVAYHHSESGTIVTVSIPKDGRTVRSADLLSIAMRLECQGLVDNTALEQFKSGRLPMAS